jgi:tetratricopeptide (TPR) repeat protein
MNPTRSAAFLLTGVLALAFAPSALGQDDDARKVFQQAQDLAKDKKYDEALPLVKKAVELDPQNDLYRATASEYELKVGKYADGLADALEAVRLNDKIGAYYILVAGNAVGEQDLDRARRFCELVLKRGPAEMGAGPCKDAAALLDLVTPRTYTLHWDLDPAKGHAVGGSIAVAVPKGNLPYQTATYEITGVQTHRLVKGAVNDVLYIVPQGKKTAALVTKVTVKPYSYKKELAAAAKKPLPAEARAYLGPCEGVNPASPTLRKVAAKVKGADTVATVRNILAWLKKNVEYKLDKTLIGELDFDSVDEIVGRGHAECRGYAMLFTGLCRAAGIPARPIWGLARVGPGDDKRFGDIASHNWGEFYVADVGWVPVDPQKPETLGCLPPSCIRIYMDARRSKTSTENLPMLNLALMFGGKVRFEEER